MNIHPLLVHFPIALLCLYVLFEIIRIKKLQHATYWFYTKAILIITGTISGLFTLLSGDTAEHAYRGASSRDLIELHSNFAGASMFIFGALALVYIITWLRMEHFLIQNTYMRSVYKYTNYFYKPWIMITLAIIGFVLLGITGTLGGALVYGSHADIFTETLFNLFGLK